MEVPKLKPKVLRCRKCGHKIGIVRPKIRFSAKLIIIAGAIAITLEIIANLIIEIAKYALA
jgi:uncharacterized protein (DUF983 family)